MNTTPFLTKDGVSDADLMRAARDLLAALIDAGGILNEEFATFGSDTPEQRAITAARAAILKAHGAV